MRPAPRLRLFTLLAWLGVGSACWAQQPVEWLGELAAATELTDRGLTVGPRKPLVQGQLAAYLAGNWTVSVAASLQGGSTRDSRLLARLGRSWTLSNDWQAEAGLGYYAYPGDPVSRNFDRVEAGASAGFRDLVSLGVTALHYPAWPGRRAGLHWALDLGLRWPLGEAWSLTASLGRADLPQDSRQHYGYGGLGLAWQQGPWRAEVNRLAADAKARYWMGDGAQARWSAMIARNF
ncbi:hypothetical protein [Aquabacterium sp.]|uniref:hypothetical protein n=1 Tax=Aquabacterium sp. TaxID=1872578 RepID=UPI002B7AD7B9|nr:hypothetical protein [Aquabacterium sp.]HSW04323.1 hypothetical protein [Aquabacterium sp.]